MSLLQERIMMNRKSDKRYMEKLSKSLDELVQELDPHFDPWNQECLENKREQLVDVKSLEVISTEKFIVENKIENWQNNLEEKLGFGSDSISIGGNY